MKIKELYKLYRKHYLVDTDSRKIRKNTIFFALTGENFNGNTFAENAIKLGASHAIIDDEKYNTLPNIILVKNVLSTLQALAKYHRKQLNIPIIGLTGSNGKTTSKELINAILSTKYKTHATFGNLNNHIGVPLTLLSMHPSTEIGIVEMGANHQKEISFLANICKPDYGYITNFGKAHLEGFGGIEGVIKGKSELYDYLKENNKIAFVNPTDSIQLEKTSSIERIFFEESIKLLSVNPSVNITYKNKIIESNLVGKYNYTNLAIAITIGKYFNITEKAIKNAIEAYTSNNNRSQIIKKTHNTILLDAYNANPSSMKVALESFSNTNFSKSKTVILGDMYELGKDSIKEHTNITELANSLKFENIIFVGDYFFQTKTENTVFKNYNELANHLKNNPLKHQYILIKASRGMALERLLDLID